MIRPSGEDALDSADTGCCQVEVETEQKVDETKSSPSLKTLAIQGSVWIALGYGGSQVLRLGSNLLLAWLLFPEAFGLMALVNVFMHGLQMISDTGIRGSILYHRRGDHHLLENFLNSTKH